MAALASDWLIHFCYFSGTAERNSTNLDRKQNLNVLFQVCVFRTYRKTKMAILAFDGLIHFRSLLSNCWKKINQTRQEASSQRPVPRCFFPANRKIKMATPTSDWLIYFYFFSEITEWNSTKFDRKQDLNILYHVQYMSFPDRLENQDDRPNHGLSEAFFTSSLQTLNEIQRNFTGSKCSTSSTKCVFSGPIKKPRWPHWRLID